MNKVVKSSMIIIGVYLIFVLYLFLAANRFENLENKANLVNNVEINVSE